MPVPVGGGGGGGVGGGDLTLRVSDACPSRPEVPWQQIPPCHATANIPANIPAVRGTRTYRHRYPDNIHTPIMEELVQ